MQISECLVISENDGDFTEEHRTTPDWSENARKADHLWVASNVSGDFCYVGESNCLRTGPRAKCSSCSIVVHQNCLDHKKLTFRCRATFENKPPSHYRKTHMVHHHWVRRFSEKTRCQHCSKNFQCKISFSSKEFISVSCTWCKVAYHNRDSCFSADKKQEECSLGAHKSIIVPPHWILKLPKEKSSDIPGNQNESGNKIRQENLFLIRSIPNSEIRPLIVFINPRSGGNQGLRLLQKFQWLLNPRQIFDLTQGGPKLGLEMYRNVHNLRVLACGGDGTVGWVLSVIDQIGMTPAPAVGVLPLGTGNDLARALGWGGGYTDEPVSEILSNMSNSQPVFLDRWHVHVEKNPNSDANEENGKDNLPLNVINNYFSLGVDAHIALEFHEAREAHPAKFNSRLKNKMFYGQLGGKDLLQRKWKSLTHYLTLECDGKDFTPKLKELKCHALVFLNIPSYGGGTRPWNSSMGSSLPSTEDGLIEVVGLTTYQLPLLQAGGHGTCITQCKTAKIVTSKTIPMQVDGEPCKVNPSIFTISLLNKAMMLAHKKMGIQNVASMDVRNLEIEVYYISMPNFERYCSDRSVLVKSAIKLHKFDVEYSSHLSNFRDNINSFLSNSKDECLSNDWYFLDCGVTEKLQKIDREEEDYHYVSDIIYENNLYIVEYINETRPLTPKSEGNVDDQFEGREGKEEKVMVIRNIPKEPAVVKKPPAKAPRKTNKAPQPEVKLVFKPKKLSERLFDMTDDALRNYGNHQIQLRETIMDAFGTKDPKVAQFLKRQGFCSALRSSAGCNLLHAACINGDIELVNYMINYIFTDFNMVEHLMEK
ncbi:eye-specific diacylglycerol kinase isoform X2 [Coccinella septempunctata]|uniref:eye-specific diacylglycerol kinase isoform X2 n=1 Tax=Coccinella septempunctata TaxID=41139 RepID=UPI001D06FB10|nr:eye-specific diacylglycerol kinase isoform X2 [Coccinella septempunctata]